MFDCIFYFFDIKLNKFRGGYMASFIKGNYRKSLFQGDNGYIVGLFKIKEAITEKVSPVKIIKIEIKIFLIAMFESIF